MAPPSLCRVALTAGLLALSTSALAWNAAGHRLTAAIAWQQMDPSTQEIVGQILAHHPDHTQWISRFRKSDASATPAYAAFVEASTWPDDIKRDARFYKDGEPATELLSGFPDMLRHQDWHYTNQSINKNHPDQEEGGELGHRLPLLIERVRQFGRPDNERAYALSWLIHLVGDAHQPLHVGSRVNADGKFDAGGNTLWIENFFHPRRSSMTLHAYWDDLPGPPWLRGPQLTSTANRLSVMGDNSMGVGTIHQWLEESRELAATAAYYGLDGETPVISTAYHERAIKTAQHRIALAGKRLALLLKSLLNP